MIDLALQLLVVVMMVAIGLELRVTQLIDGLRDGRWIAGALILNVVAVPAAVWAVAHLGDSASGMAVGFVLLAAAPAGPIGPMLSRLSQADLGFSTALMVLLGAVGLISTPITVGVISDTGPDADRSLTLAMFVALLVFQIVPLIAAMALGAWFPAVAAVLTRPLRLLANLLLVGIVVALVVLRGDLLLGTSLAVHLALVAGLVVVLAPSLAMARPESMLRSLLTVTAVRNMSIALFLASRFFDDPQVEAGILIWSFWMIVIPGMMGSIAGRFRTAELVEQPQSSRAGGREPWPRSAF